MYQPVTLELMAKRGVGALLRDPRMDGRNAKPYFKILKVSQENGEVRIWLATCSNNKPSHNNIGAEQFVHAKWEIEVQVRNLNEEVERCLMEYNLL